jgi:hypothetical protein
MRPYGKASYRSRLIAAGLAALGMERSGGRRRGYRPEGASRKGRGPILAHHRRLLVAGRSARDQWLRAAAGGLCAIGGISLASAAPPFSRETKLTAQLDLRLPPLATIAHGRESSPVEEAFPSSIHHLDHLTVDIWEGDRPSQPLLDAGGLAFRTVNPVEAIASRIRREGLPIARLWQSKSALLSIGLNQKGKLGLWLTKKLQ